MTKYIEIDGIGEFVPRSEYDALAAKLATISDEIMAIINDSRGVDGYHLNGDVATWDSFNLVDIILVEPQQHLANMQAEAQSGGWQEYCWPEKVPPSKHEFYITDAGCLFYDNGAWLEPTEYNGWNPTSAKVTKFFVVPEQAEQVRRGEVE